ncbi:hypothetical protein PINS_up007619 [Pythium insidiosum]|nr:hypothetical protein PINS_up007619 [Pythium insidiosum]
MQQTEEHMAAQNASFVARQEQELERFEAQILDEKEERHRVLLEARRQVLADAFEKDLKTYQTLVSYQGTTLAQRTSPLRGRWRREEAIESSSCGSCVGAMTPEPKETLESIDLVVATDATTLEAFYDSEEEETETETEARGVQLSARLVQAEEEEKEEKEEEKAEEVTQEPKEEKQDSVI